MVLKLKIDMWCLFHQEKESWDMVAEEKVEAAGKKKEEGNVLFKAGKYLRASKRYEKVSCTVNMLGCLV